MTDVFGDVLKLQKVKLEEDYLIVEIIIPKSLAFMGRTDEQIRYEDLHFGRVRIIQDDWKADV